jgi:hypothetical protein
VLKRIFGPKREEVTRNGENCAMRNFTKFTSKIIRVNISRKMGWAGHVVRMGEIRYSYSSLVRKSKGKRRLRDLDLDERIILK